MDVLEELHVAADDEQVISLLVHDFIAGDEGIGARMAYCEVQGDGYASFHRCRDSRQLERVLACVKRIAWNERHPTLPAAASCFGRGDLRVHRTEPRRGSRRRRALLCRGGGHDERQSEQEASNVVYPSRS